MVTNGGDIAPPPPQGRFATPWGQKLFSAPRGALWASAVLLWCDHIIPLYLSKIQTLSICVKKHQAQPSRWHVNGNEACADVYNVMKNKATFIGPGNGGDRWNGEIWKGRGGGGVGGAVAKQNNQKGEKGCEPLGMLIAHGLLRQEDYNLLSGQPLIW